MHVKPTDGKPYLLRAFVQHGGKQYSHAISVGFPSQINYAIDLSQGKLLCAWRGEFVDASPIWHERGGGNIPPLGSVVDWQAAPIAAVLANEQSAFPDSTGIIYKGMELDNQGIPTFRYLMGSVTLITDRISAVEDGRILLRHLNITTAPANTYVRLAKGSITKVDEGLFLINSTHYLRMVAEQAAQVKTRTIGGQSELIWATPTGSNATLRYQVVF